MFSMCQVLDEILMIYGNILIYGIIEKESIEHLDRILTEYEFLWMVEK